MRVGLTGNIGSGKSSAARLLAARGAVVIDADDLARQAANVPDVLLAVERDLGPELIDLSEPVAPRLDRAATARLVFADPQALAKLNAIIHPWVRRRSAELEALAALSQPPPEVIVHDIPLLYENGLAELFDAVIVVNAPLAERVARVVKRSGLSEAEVIRRDAAQMPLKLKVQRADLVIDNAGGEAALEQEVARVWAELSARRRAT